MTLHAQALAGSGRADLRRALKRGRAREALMQAADAEMAALVRLGADLSPNPHSRDRVARRLARLRGVVRVALGRSGEILVLTRRVRQVITRAEGADLFAETALIYTRVTLTPRRGGPGFGLLQASFCLHALERLVERSAVPLDVPLLPAVDAEAAALLRDLSRGRMIEDAGSQLLRARAEGVWAGSLDTTAPDADWNLVPTSANALQVFSVRTFLGPDQMRPTLWLKWRGDPALSVA